MIKDFEYYLPKATEQALTLFSKNSAYKAGGIDLLDLLKENIVSYDSIINLSGIDSLDFIDTEIDLKIGAGVSIQKIADSQPIQKYCPALSESASEIATPHIRNIATLGGNLCQKPRCWYFRSKDFDCSRKGGKVCFAIDGENKYHSIYGNQDGCAFVNPSGMATVLTALNARLQILTKKEIKTINLRDFYYLPAEKLTCEHKLNDGEILLSVTVEKENLLRKNYYCKIKEKQSSDWPIAEICIIGGINSLGNFENVSIVLGSAAPIPWRMIKEEKKLEGLQATTKYIGNVVESSFSDANPLRDNAYKVKLFRTLLYRGLCSIAGLESER
ncbi:MAG: FAD binding domain-containing protein [Ignavibacteriales bacterium]|nr:FAD binding domain-containing protein [Ignavibacteriales bacterium]